MTIIYISGPISGIKDHNRPLFNMVAAELADQGHSVLNPATLPDGLSQGQYMQIFLPMVAVAHELVMLPGWEQSEGGLYRVLPGQEVRQDDTRSGRAGFASRRRR